MSVESAAYFAQFDIDSPPGTGTGSGKYEGDNHLRLIKEVCQTQFPNLGTSVSMNASSTELNYMIGMTGSAIPASWTYFGTAATYDVGTDIGDVVSVVNVGGHSALPSLDGSQLTNVQTTDTLVADIEMGNTKDGAWLMYFMGQL